jgi:predicted NBD/HSP70 family sugar kinase
MHWKNIDVRTRLQSRTGLPAHADNDVNCMAIDLLGNSDFSDLKHMVVVYIAEEGQGLGSALLAGGQIVRGATGGAGEFGHVTIQPAGARCRCGSRGCLEALLSVDTLAREINWGGKRWRGTKGVSTMAEAASLVEDGVLVAETAFRRAGRNFGQGLAVLVNLFNPDRILVGGPGPYFSREEWPSANRLFQDEYETAVADYSFSDLQDGCKIEVVRLNPETAASGAARMAISQEIF